MAQIKSIIHSMNNLHVDAFSYLFPDLLIPSGGSSCDGIFSPIIFTLSELCNSSNKKGKIQWKASQKVEFKHANFTEGSG